MLKTSQQFRQIPELSVSYVLEGTTEWLGVSGFGLLVLVIYRNFPEPSFLSGKFFFVSGLHP